MRHAFSIGAVLLPSGCATAPDQIKATYVAPAMYQDYDCKQLELEAGRLSELVSEKSGIRERNRGSDAAIATAAIVIFWPALFFLNGDGANASQIARLKGRIEAVEDASAKRKCGIEFQRI